MENTSRRFVSRELDKKDFTHQDAVRAIRCWFVVHTDYGGYVENDFTFHRWEDGSITISENDGNGFISIHDKEILEIMRNLLIQL